MLIKLGAGTSLPGLVAAKIGAQNVVLCDNPKVEKWFPLIREIITMNSMIADRIRIEFLDWYDESSIDEFIKKYFPLNIDIIFGSDIFFHKKGRKRNTLFFLLNQIFILDFETILALLDKLFTCGHSDLKFIGTIERRR
jgi:predicted nicotinamide N-methyase